MMRNRVLLASRILIVIGVFCLLAGGYFLFVRPLFIMQPEDVRVAKITATELKTQYPDMFHWLGFVIRAWGLFVFSNGVLLIYIARNAFRNKERWAWYAVAIAGVPNLAIFLWIQILMVGEGRFIIGPMLIVLLLALSLSYLDFFRADHA